MSDLFKNHIIGFPTRWLKYLSYAADSVGEAFLKIENPIIVKAVTQVM